MITPFTPARAILVAVKPPAFASLIPPVSGDFPPTLRRPEEGAGVPERRPGEITNLFFSRSGWHAASTSALTTADVNARPPRVS